ncbi:uncharacterized protein LOC123008042 [Tribolium madens]|uniref:uncharacterized protein LOC123008042 n=1 Tax=Tribolium madens TaxID=41895 RepID=UPI001CF7318A|nr:uncharacterized protein LOC123008042 [Tribolium madens]
MYCVLQYIDYLNFKRFRDTSSATVTSLQSSDEEIVNSTLYFNPNCTLQLILDYICIEAHLNVDGTNYDLCNGDGDLLGIKDYKPNASGLTIFHRRETYFLVMIKRNDSGTTIEEITPLLNPQSTAYQNLIKNMNKKLNKKRNSFAKRRSNSSKHSITPSQSSNTSTINNSKKKI